MILNDADDDSYDDVQVVSPCDFLQKQRSTLYTASANYIELPQARLTLPRYWEEKHSWRWGVSYTARLVHSIEFSWYPLNSIDFNWIQLIMIRRRSSVIYCKTCAFNWIFGRQLKPENICLSRNTKLNVALRIVNCVMTLIPANSYFLFDSRASITVIFSWGTN